MTKRYAALSLVPLAALLLGYAALSAPESLRGPLLVARPMSPLATLGLTRWLQPMYLADVLGLLLVALAMTLIWIIALAWKIRHQPR